MELKLPNLESIARDLFRLNRRIEEDKLMDTWSIKPGTGNWCRGYWFEWGMAFEDIPAGTFIQRLKSIMDTNAEGKYNCIWQRWIPQDPGLQDYPEAFTLCAIPKDAFFWAQHLLPYEQVASSRKKVFDRMGFNKK